VVIFAWVAGLLWLLIGLVVPVVAARVIGVWYRQQRAAEQLERQRQAEIAARADQQHQWVLEGDERGVYGDYTAAAL
jgi:uncharacterized membrane-anchored protein YhcB (DUF1043 family)